MKREVRLVTRDEELPQIPVRHWFCAALSVGLPDSQEVGGRGQQTPPVGFCRDFIDVVS